MSPSDGDIPQARLLEYQTAIEQYQHCTTLRRQDMAFVMTGQGAALTIIGKELLAMDVGAAVLSSVAFLLLIVGFNSERRLAAYMAGYARRAVEIETQYGLSVLIAGTQEVRSRRALLSNSIVFPSTYALLAAAWSFVWVVNVVM